MKLQQVPHWLGQQVDEAAFDATQDTASHPSLAAMLEAVEERFGIDWSSVSWPDLTKPLWCGLAASLRLSLLPAPIPADLDGQAAYWEAHYHTAPVTGTQATFKSAVLALETGE